MHILHSAHLSWNLSYDRVGEQGSKMPAARSQSQKFPYNDLRNKAGRGEFKTRGIAVRYREDEVVPCARDCSIYRKPARSSGQPFAVERRILSWPPFLISQSTVLQIYTSNTSTRSNYLSPLPGR